jgi:hypothetical protein
MTEKVVTNGSDEKRSCGNEDGCLGCATQSSSHLSGAPKLIDGGSGPMVVDSDRENGHEREARGQYLLRNWSNGGYSNSRMRKNGWF